jgi:hypothetical protein
MIPPVGSVAAFVFATPFVTLNGVYQIVKTMTFETALASGVDFVASLYTPAGRNKTDYASEYTNYAGQTVLQLQGVGDSTGTIYYAPLGVLAQVPDPTIKRYVDAYMNIHIGAFADETVYTWLKSQIDDLVAAVTGNTDTAQFYTNPADDLYLTDAQYASLAAARAANIRTVMPVTVQNQALQTTIDALQTKIRAYQTMLVNLYTRQGAIQTVVGNVTSRFGKLASSATASN